ncbi:MAG: hypothetical protein ACK5LT_12405 [Lachnospirales bacterium]
MLDEGVEDEKIICVFYKIIEQSDKEDADCEFDREKLLNIFKKYKEKISNQIFLDYYEYLQRIDAEVNSFEETPIQDWTDKMFIGFFKHLRKTVLEGDTTHWGYISNPKGGFMGLWITSVLGNEDLIRIGFHKKCIKDLYLQLEYNYEINKCVICIKYLIDDKETVYGNCKAKIFNYKNKISYYFQEQVGKVYTKTRNYFGEHMTVGYVTYNKSDYVTKLLLMKNTLKNLKI